MKFKTTKKAIMNGYDNIIIVKYGSMCNLLPQGAATAYTTRTEGWAADVYDFGNTAIVTGYVPFGNIRADYELCTKYDNQAKAIDYDNSIDWDDKKNKKQQLINDFITEVTAL